MYLYACLLCDRYNCQTLSTTPQLVYISPTMAPSKNGTFMVSFCILIIVMCSRFRLLLAVLVHTIEVPVRVPVLVVYFVKYKY